MKTKIITIKNTIINNKIVSEKNPFFLSFFFFKKNASIIRRKIWKNSNLFVNIDKNNCSLHSSFYKMFTLDCAFQIKLLSKYYYHEVW